MFIPIRFLGVTCFLGDIRTSYREFILSDLQSIDDAVDWVAENIERFYDNDM